MARQSTRTLETDQLRDHVHLGEPSQTRYIVMANEEAAIAPPRSIHAGVGTSSYTFCRSMAGDTVDFTDPVAGQPPFGGRAHDILINNAGIIRRADAIDFAEAAVYLCPPPPPMCMVQF